MWTANKFIKTQKHDVINSEQGHILHILAFTNMEDCNFEYDETLEIMLPPIKERTMSVQENLAILSTSIMAEDSMAHSW